MEDRIYQEKKQSVEEFIKRYGKADHYIILNNVDVGYDTLNILSDLQNECRLLFFGIHVDLLGFNTLLFRITSSPNFTFLLLTTIASPQIGTIFSVSPFSCPSIMQLLPFIEV